METLLPNYIDTTTAIIVNSNTTTAEFIMRRDTTYQYSSSGFNNDLTTTTLRINFTETLAVSRIILSAMNFRGFDVYYNGVTANTFVIAAGALTTASTWTANSETSLYLAVTSVNCTSVSIDVRNTQSANAEKALGYCVLSNIIYTFDRIPNASNYKPVLDSIQVSHRLSNGSTRTQIIEERWSFNLKYEFLDSTMVTNLRALYNRRDGFIFAPFNTGTGWDGIIAPVVWENDFEFYKYSENASTAGFSGSIKLLETEP